jgi:hypothetical protein
MVRAFDHAARNAVIDAPLIPKRQPLPSLHPAHGQGIAGFRGGATGQGPVSPARNKIAAFPGMAGPVWEKRIPDTGLRNGERARVVATGCSQE